jgi:hypothetical protein
MWNRQTAIVFVMFAGIAAGQSGDGGIAGVVKDPSGVPFAKAPITARNTSSGAQFKATSAVSGKYELKGLPAGSYDVTAAVPGVKGFEKKGLMVAAGKTTPFEIDLEDGTQLRTLGEDPVTLMADAARHVPPTGPAPRMANGKPDLSGVWWRPREVDTGNPQFLPAAEAIAKQRTDNLRKDTPQARCLPSPIVRVGPIYSIIQSPVLMVAISDDDSPGFHQIYLDGHKHPEDPSPAWYGHNIGWWEGDTLVVDRVAFNDRSWLDQDSHPHSDKLHVVERYKRPDLGHLEIEVTVDDPGVLAKPYTIKRVSDLAPAEEVYEFICPENNRDVEHLVGK